MTTLTMQRADKAPVLHMGNDRLAVAVSVPGTLYAKSRFDWSAFVLSVTLDGRHEFCVPESIDGTGTGGVSLCSEFGILGVPGFDDAAPGETFVKPGVGLLTRPDDKPYSFARPYAVEPFPCHVHRDGDAVHFITEPVDCRGIALRVQKTLRVVDDCLQLDCEMANVGRRAVSFDEYCHNFVALGGQPVGPTSTLRWSVPTSAHVMKSALQVGDRQITWTQPPTEVFYARFDVQVDAGAEAWWELTDSHTGLGMRETTSETWCRLAVYGKPRLVSPEAFIAIDLPPGGVKRWSRVFRFFHTR